MKSLKNSLFAVLSVVVAVFVTACSEDTPEKCLCGGEKVATNDGNALEFAKVKLNVLNLPDTNLPDLTKELTYYNDSYYITNQELGNTVYYFVCNKDKVFFYDDRYEYTITANARQTTNVILEQLDPGKNRYYELEILTIDTLPLPEDKK